MDAPWCAKVRSWAHPGIQGHALGHTKARKGARLRAKARIGAPLGAPRRANGGGRGVHGAGCLHQRSRWTGLYPDDAFPPPAGGGFSYPAPYWLGTSTGIAAGSSVPLSFPHGAPKSALGRAKACQGAPLGAQSRAKVWAPHVEPRYRHGPISRLAMPSSTS